MSVGLGPHDDLVRPVITEKLARKGSVMTPDQRPERPVPSIVEALSGDIPRFNFVVADFSCASVPGLEPRAQAATAIAKSNAYGLIVSKARS